LRLSTDFIELIGVGIDPDRTLIWAFACEIPGQREDREVE